MTWLRLVLVFGSLWGGLGCKPKIGEDCATSVDCSISGDRLCDVTQPGGYCTVFNCEPNNCPDESVCVGFGEGTCSTPSIAIRFRRTFCMRSCEDDDDCRGGSYRCIDVSRDQARQIVDTNPSSRRICAVPASPPPAVDTSLPEPGVCFPSDASFDVSRPETGPVSRDAPSESDAAEASADVASDSSPGETGADASADTDTDVVDDVADEQEAAFSPP